MFTRKHFKEIASILSEINDTETRHQVSLRFAQYFKNNNPRFDIQRFIVACETIKL